MQQQWTGAFAGDRGVTSAVACSDARWGFTITHDSRLAFGTGDGACCPLVEFDVVVKLLKKNG